MSRRTPGPGGRTAAAPRFFRTPADFRAWLVRHHAAATELLVGFYKKGSGKPSITWPESVDEALAVGWIDGIRRRIDDESYSIRFTPRKPGSIWSLVNTKRVEALTREGRMLPAGLEVFAARDPEKTGIYSFERAAAAFPPDYEARFRANATAWAYFSGRGAYYRRVATYWVCSAKRDETRERRLVQLIVQSSAGKDLSQFIDPAKRAAGERPRRPARVTRAAHRKTSP
jgi:uncharacterized protein YdeI (YjbR/CyaY-like superfamily)